jgi:hypothetical protein
MNNPCDGCSCAINKSAFGISEWTLENCQELCFAHKDYRRQQEGYAKGLAEREQEIVEWLEQWDETYAHITPPRIKPRFEARLQGKE